MIRILRSLFGIRGVTGNRTVLGKPESIPVQELPYIKDSNKRLMALQELCARYKGTAHAQKLQAVYDKTKHIHTYLISRSRAYELELFHLQHTDHFLNTFTAIINTVKPLAAPTPKHAPEPPKPAGRADVIGRTFVIGPFRRETKEVRAVQVQNSESNQRIFVETMKATGDVARLAMPDISIDTYSKIVYLKQDLADGMTTNEIGYTSSSEEKETFVDFVAYQFGIEGITYVGNAMLYLPGQTPQNQPAEMVPVIYWNGSNYALGLEDNLLFPVSTFRKRK